jgi:hypothetical protein
MLKASTSLRLLSHAHHDCVCRAFAPCQPFYRCSLTSQLDMCSSRQSRQRARRCGFGKSTSCTASARSTRPRMTQQRLQALEALLARGQVAMGTVGRGAAAIHSAARARCRLAHKKRLTSRCGCAASGHITSVGDSRTCLAWVHWQLLGWACAAALPRTLRASALDSAAQPPQP